MINTCHGFTIKKKKIDYLTKNDQTKDAGFCLLITGECMILQFDSKNDYLTKKMKKSLLVFAC
jgi:hypothetical protein